MSDARKEGTKTLKNIERRTNLEVVNDQSETLGTFSETNSGDYKNRQVGSISYCETCE